MGCSYIHARTPSPITYSLLLSISSTLSTLYSCVARATHVQCRSMVKQSSAFHPLPLLSSSSSFSFSEDEWRVLTTSPPAPASRPLTAGCFATNAHYGDVWPAHGRGRMHKNCAHAYTYSYTKKALSAHFMACETKKRQSEKFTRASLRANFARCTVSYLSAH